MTDKNKNILVTVIIPSIFILLIGLLVVFPLFNSYYCTGCKEKGFEFNGEIWVSGRYVFATYEKDYELCCKYDYDNHIRFSNCTIVNTSYQRHFGLLMKGDGD